MQKTLFIILATLVLGSCQNEYKICDCNSTDDQVKLYSDILNELVEHHFYSRYLDRDMNQIFNEYSSDNADTAKIRREEIQLQNKLFNDTSKFCNIYLDTAYKPYFNQWTYYQNDTGRYAQKIKDLFLTFSQDGQLVIDSLNSMQLNLEPNDFKLCTSKMLSVRDIKTQKGKCEIGIVSFSKVFLDKTKNKGLLYCNFRCGTLCGKGELLLIEKINNQWTITDTIVTTIS